MPLTDAQKRAQKTYRQKPSVRAKDKKNQKENFANIAATLPKPEKIYIDSIFKAHGLKPSEIIRGAAAALLDGEPIRTQSEPLTIPPKAETDGENADTDEPPTT